MTRVLSLHGITVETLGGVRLVDDVSFDLHAGEVLALVGASGSGKSLTCAACLGVLPPGTRGRVEGAEPAALRGRVVASILQNPRSAFNPVLTMRTHARETLGPDDTRIIAAMRDAGLPQTALDLHPFEMSGGMLQRMMIALALASDAPFLFADEPTTDLDLIVQAEILALLDRLRTTRGLGMLLVTHDMGVVARLADRMAVMEGGRIVETGAAHALFDAPRHPVTRRLVAAHLSLYGMELSS